MIKRYMRYLMVVISAAWLAGCFGDEGVDQKYFKTFEHIKTDQFVWMYGRGGIYWVSDNAVVLDALVKNTEGVAERGIYQVNMDGSYLRLVEKTKKGPFDYCFDGKTLFIRGGEGQFNVLNPPKDYKLFLQAKAEIQKGGPYAPVRCQYMKPPRSDAGYVALKEEDGFLKNNYRTDKNPKPNTYLSDNEGMEKIVLDVGEIKIFSYARYLPDRDSYFFYRNRGNCSYVGWVARDNWRVRTKKHCFGSWAVYNSKIVLSTRVGFFIEHHTDYMNKAYLVTDEKEYPIETISAIGTALAPDGCRVAYGSGNYRARNRGPNDYRQVLKVFDSCKFMKDQGE